MEARWTDLVDPTREEILAALPVHVDPDVVEACAARAGDGRLPRPLVEGHGAYVFGVLMAPRPLPDENRIAYQEIDLVATPSLLVTVRKSPGGAVPVYEPAGVLEPAVAGGTPVGALVQKLVDDVADSFLASVDEVYAEIEELEDAIDASAPSVVRERIANFRHELLQARRMVSATRSVVRRILDGRVDVRDDALFPAEIELRFTDSYDTLVRVAEELDIARELLSGARDHHQSKIAESQGDIVKKLTVVASLVLVPSLIVGFYGQNFESEFDDGFWGLGVSLALIASSTLVQVALYRWRRWI